MEKINHYLLVLLGVFFTLLFFNSPGSSDVFRFWLPWMGDYRINGYVAGFASIGGDYPPLGMWILYALDLIASWCEMAPIVPLKIAITSFLFITSAVYFYLCRNVVTTFLMHFMLVLSSTILLYLDVFYAPFLLLAFWSLKQDKPLQAMILYIVACSIKYQPLIISPIFFLGIYKHYQQHSPNTALKDSLKTILIPGAVATALMLAIHQQALFDSLYIALTHSKYSFQAMNIYWVYVNGVTWATGEAFKHANNPESMLYISRGLFALLYCFLLHAYFKHGKNYSDFLLYCLAGYYCYFILITGVHENHLTVAAIVASLLYIHDEKYRGTSLFIMAVSNLNMLIFYGLNGEGLGYSLMLTEMPLMNASIFIAALNCVFFLVLLWHVFFAAKRPYRI